MSDTYPKVVVQLMHEHPRLCLQLPAYHTIENQQLIHIDPGDIVTDEALRLLRTEDRIEAQ